MAFGRRLSGMGTPALAHIAAALALAISSNWSLSSSVRRGGVLLVLRRVRDPERRCLRRMRTGEWLGSLFHLSRLSNERLRNTGRLPRPLDLDLRLRSVERDLDRLLLSTDRFLRPVERLLDRLLLSADLDLLLPRRLGERDRLFRVGGERDLDRRFLVRDLECDLLRLAGERDFFRRAGLRDLDRRFFLSGGETESLFLTGDLDLDGFLRDADLDVDRRGGEVERDGFLRSVGEQDLDSCLTGEVESSPSSDPSESSDRSGAAAGSLEPDLDLETSCSLAELTHSCCSLSWLGEGA